MKHPVFLLSPVLMVADYFLTLAAATIHERRHAKQFPQENYELNPVWQKSIAQRKWFNPRHLFLVALTCGLLALLFEVTALPDPLAECLLGALFVAEGMLVGRHVSNILIYRRMARTPEQVTGQVTMSHAVTLSVSAYHYLTVAVPLVLVALVDPTPAVLGGVLGAVSMFLAHGIWIWRHRRTLARQVGEPK